jgi:hypothetical protein
MIKILLTLLCLSLEAYDPLPSWNEGSAKKRIVDFVNHAVQTVPEENRIATFDEDGTLWVEQPAYTEFFFARDTSKDVKPGEYTKEEVAKLVVETHSGMTVDDFQLQVSKWLETAVHPRFKRPFTELVYQPMLEVMNYLKDNKFSVYIVSGGGQEFIRTFAEKVYGLPPSHVIGSAGKVKYEYREGKPVLMKLPELLFIDDKGGKPEGINLIIGKRPIIAFGNSDGDRQMLEWTNGLQILIHHDDAEREYAYGPDSKVGTFSNALMDEALKNKWIVVSMKNDWKTLFPPRKD